jgi:hypothetical protein
LTQSTDRSIQVVAEFSEIIRGAVDKLTVGLGPHEFGRVELGRVGGKQVHTLIDEDEMGRAGRLSLSAALQPSALKIWQPWPG